MIARVCLWSVLAFVLNLAWEIGHVRLYALWMEADGSRVAWSILHCSLGDVLIALAVIGAMAFTAWSEWYNVYRVGAWSYTPKMPTLYGVGLSPLLQWLIIPLLMVGAFRALLPVLKIKP